MIDSPIHELLTDIRKKYTGKKVSIIDIRNIEEKYHLCSLMNIRNDGCAFLRITSFGCDEVVFEDIVINTNLVNKDTSIDDLMFKLNQLLYENAYGVVLIKSDKSIIDVPITMPSYDFHTLKEENNRLSKKCEELELKLESINNKGTQISLFDSNND